MTFALPAHPFLTHPLTGLALQAIGFRKNGTPIWPVMGASDDPPADDGGNPPADPPPADEPTNKGFPADTPVKDMTPDQQAAYWKDKAQTHEGRNKSILKLTGGKYGDDLKAELEELEKLRTAQLTDSEKAVEEAKTETRAEVAAEFATKLVAAEFRAALAHVDEDRREQIIEGVALDKFLTDGDVDADKVKSHVAAIAPADKAPKRHDYGGGHRGGDNKSGVSAGADRYRERHGKTDKDDA